MEKKGFLDQTNAFFKKMEKVEFFLKGLVYDFGKKLEIFKIFCFWKKK